MRKKSDHLMNAITHGAFSSILILPWESKAEFAELYDELIDEWKPVGRTEQDAVLSIAKGIWRKRRMQAFLRNELEKHTCDPNHVAYNEAEMLRTLYHLIEMAPDTFETWPLRTAYSEGERFAAKVPSGEFSI